VTIYTIGHSTRTAAEFLALLRAHGIRQLADVRTIPRSARHPHFTGDALMRTLASDGIGYRHFPALGGLRRPRRDSPNGGLRNTGFRGYADHMATEEFRGGVDALLQWAEDAPTTVMCAEALWWRCHRSLLADTLLTKHVEVRHVLSSTSVSVHTLHTLARHLDGILTYPGLV
jgi:uncharacterized protein (DUF488 family)